MKKFVDSVFLVSMAAYHSFVGLLWTLLLFAVELVRIVVGVITGSIGWVIKKAKGLWKRFRF
jgi:hypothetical protein